MPLVAAWLAGIVLSDTTSVSDGQKPADSNPIGRLGVSDSSGVSDLSGNWGGSDATPVSEAVRAVSESTITLPDTVRAVSESTIAVPDTWIPFSSWIADGPSVAVALLVSVALLIAVRAAGAVRRVGRRGLAAVGIILLACMLGFARDRLAAPDLAAPHVAAWNGLDVTLAGRIGDEPWRRDSRVLLRLDIDAVLAPEDPRHATADPAVESAEARRAPDDVRLASDGAVARIERIDVGLAASLHPGPPVIVNGRASPAQGPQSAGDELPATGDWLPAHGRILAAVPAHPPPEYGDRVLVTGKLEAPEPIENFDYPAYLARRDIYSVMWRPTVDVIGAAPRNRVRSVLLDVKARGKRALAQSLPEPESALATGILLGDARGIPEAVDEAFQRTNTTHVIAISGSNIALVVAFLMLILSKWLGRRRAVAPVIIGVVVYTALVGADAAVVRAALMGGVAVVAVLAGRPADAASALMVAAFGMTLYKPDYVWDLGFQLSFAATTGLILYSRGFADRVERLAVAGRSTGMQQRVRVLLGLLNEAVLVTLAAQITTWPLVAYHTGALSIAGIFTNALIVPAQGPVMGLAALTALAGSLNDSLGRLVGFVAWLPLAYTIRCVELTARWPLSSVAIPLGVAPVVGYYFTLWLMTSKREQLRNFGCRLRATARERSGQPHQVWSLESPREQSLAPSRVAPLGPPPEPSRDPPPESRSPSGASTARESPLPSRLEELLGRGPVVVAAGVLALAALVAAGEQPDGLLHIEVLDVGQGDAILIQSPGGRRMLIDGGPAPRLVLDALGRRFAPWDRRLDVVVLTHPDADHVGGLAEVVERYDIGYAIDSGIASDGSESQAWRTALLRREVPSAALQAGARIVLDPTYGVAADVLWPPEGHFDSSEAKTNNNSVVLRLVYGELRVLLTGDIEAPAEGRLAVAEDLRAQVLKVAHHGSATSTTPEFLALVRPAVALIPVGADNDYGHPDPSVVERLEAESRVISTDRVGAIHLTSDGLNLWIVQESS